MTRVPRVDRLLTALGQSTTKLYQPVLMNFMTVMTLSTIRGIKRIFSLLKGRKSVKLLSDACESVTMRHRPRLRQSETHRRLICNFKTFVGIML